MSPAAEEPLDTGCAAETSGARNRPPAPNSVASRIRSRRGNICAPIVARQRRLWRQRSHNGETEQQRTNGGGSTGVASRPAGNGGNAREQPDVVPAGCSRAF